MQGQIDAAYDCLQKAQSYQDKGYWMRSLEQTRYAQFHWAEASLMAGKAADYLTGLKDLKDEIDLQMKRLGWGAMVLSWFMS